MDAGINTVLIAKLTINGLVTIALVWGWIYYELHRKWDSLENSAKGFSKVVAMLTRYRIAIVVAAVVVPGWADLLPKLWGGGN